MKKFQDQLRELRMKSGLSQSELANKIFVSRTLITKYECGKAKPSKENIEKLALFFNVKLSYFEDVIIQNDKISKKINLVFCSIIFLLFLSFLLFVSLPYISYNTFNSHKISNPTLFWSGLEITLYYKNYFILITLATLLSSVVLSILSLVKPDKIWYRYINYALFIINILLVIFSVMCVISYSESGYFLQ